ncbi:hypothetical protein D2T31_00525 [Sinirhodobacter populi]|uniref:Uncharacterized protein n=1 Tax=Paenirhodobacter populi TaxID=2306993 RepID=A0A443KI96_9RHOB|nr:hypothetical protein [Sinirhodobacter populi]RWR32502.1 hypothetical protein D2T31_00525 [Sinirhodobacter populi]
MADENARPASIEIPVLFDLMDRMQCTRLLGTLDHLRVSLEWAVQNDLFQDRVEHTQRIVVMGADWGRDDHTAVQIVTGHDDKQDRAGDGGDTVAAPEPPQGCALSCGEGAEAPASASAGDAGGETEPPPASVEQDTPAAVPLSATAGGGTGSPRAAVPEPEAVRPASGSAPYIHGPMSDAEKAEARRLHAEGLTPYEIAQKLRRRPQAVFAVVNRGSGKPKPAAAKPKKEMLGGERGGLQRHSPVEKAPVQAEEVSSIGANSSAEAPSGKPAVSRGPIAEDNILIAEGPETAAAIGGICIPRAEPITDTTRPLWWREIEANLNALGHKGPWTAALDLALVEGLTRGTPLPVLADELGVEVGQAKARFIAMTPDAVDRFGRRAVTIELQQQLIEVLRARVEARD